MSAVSENTIVAITRTVTVTFMQDEFLPARGDRKGNSWRVARAIQIRIKYTFSAGAWHAGWSALSSLVEQQKVGGSWSEPKWTYWGALGADVERDLVARFMPQTSYTIAEATK